MDRARFPDANILESLIVFSLDRLPRQPVEVGEQHLVATERVVGESDRAEPEVCSRLMSIPESVAEKGASVIHQNSCGGSRFFVSLQLDQISHFGQGNPGRINIRGLCFVRGKGLITGFHFRAAPYFQYPFVFLTRFGNKKG